MPYYIRKKSASTWTHGASEKILSQAYFRLYDTPNGIIFELTEPAGSDNAKVLLTDIILVDETQGTTEETFTSSVTFIDRLKALAYPFFKSASGGSGAVDSVYGRTGDVVASNGDYSMSQITNGIPTGGGANQVLKKASATDYNYTWQDEAGGGSSLFLGTYTSLVNLTTAHPDPEDGSTANIDEGIGEDVRRALWDNDDDVWVLGSAVSTPTQNLQQVTDEGNTTTNDIEVQGELTVGNGGSASILMDDGSGGQIEADGGQITIYHDFNVAISKNSGNANEVVTQGTDYNATTNTPTLSNSDTFKKSIWHTVTNASTPTTVNFGGDDIIVQNNDILANDGTIWYKKVDNNQSGGGASTKLKQFLEATFKYNVNDSTVFYGFDFRQGYNLDVVNESFADDGNGFPTHEQRNFGFFLPKGYKVNNLIYYDVGNGTNTGDLRVLAYKKTTNNENGDYSVTAGNSNYTYTLLYDDFLYANSTLTTLIQENNGVAKRTFPMSTLNDINQSPDQDATLLFYIQIGTSGTKNNSGKIIWELEEI